MPGERLDLQNPKTHESWRLWFEHENLYNYLSESDRVQCRATLARFIDGELDDTMKRDIFKFVLGSDNARAFGDIQDIRAYGIRLNGDGIELLTPDKQVLRRLTGEEFFKVMTKVPGTFARNTYVSTVARHAVQRYESSMLELLRGIADLLAHRKKLIARIRGKQEGYEKDKRHLRMLVMQQRRLEDFRDAMMQERAAFLREQIAAIDHKIAQIDFKIAKIEAEIVRVQSQIDAIDKKIKWHEENIERLIETKINYIKEETRLIKDNIEQDFGELLRWKDKEDLPIPSFVQEVVEWIKEDVVGGVQEIFEDIGKDTKALFEGIGDEFKDTFDDPDLGDKSDKVMGEFIEDINKLFGEFLDEEMGQEGSEFHIGTIADEIYYETQDLKKALIALDKREQALNARYANKEIGHEAYQKEMNAINEERSKAQAESFSDIARVAGEKGSQMGRAFGEKVARHAVSQGIIAADESSDHADRIAKTIGDKIAKRVEEKVRARVDAKEAACDERNHAQREQARDGWIGADRQLGHEQEKVHTLQDKKSSATSRISGLDKIRNGLVDEKRILVEKKSPLEEELSPYQNDNKSNDTPKPPPDRTTDALPSGYSKARKESHMDLIFQPSGADAADIELLEEMRLKFQMKLNEIIHSPSKERDDLIAFVNEFCDSPDFLMLSDDAVATETKQGIKAYALQYSERVKPGLHAPTPKPSITSQDKTLETEALSNQKLKLSSTDLGSSNLKAR